MIVQYISFELLPVFSADSADKMAFAILQFSLVVFALRVVLHGKWFSFGGSDGDKPALKPSFKPSITFTFLEDSQFSLIKKEWEGIQKLHKKLESLELASSDKKELGGLTEKALRLMTDFEKLYKVDMVGECKKARITKSRSVANRIPYGDAMLGSVKKTMDKYKKTGGGISYKDTMLENMRSIKNRLSELLSLQVGKMTSGLLNFSVEDGKVINEAETRYEALLGKGKELLRLMSENEQAFSDENSFVIKKLVDERLPSLHEDYLKSLKASDDISKPTEIFQQVLDELDTLFTQSELEFNEINAENAIQNLLVQQRYMSNRI